MKYFAEVNGREHEVEVRERLGELEVAVDGERLDLDYCEVDALGQLSVLHGTLSFGASIEGGPNEFGVTIAGHFYQVEIEDERERAAHAAEREARKAGGLLKSVMPGVVVEVRVAEGDTVAEGQPLLILEAMKMQNEMGAPTAGTVTKVHVAEGEAVAGGQSLVTITAGE